MSDMSDEMLMAHADGVLGDAERQQVAEFLARHPEAQQRVTAFSKTHGTLHRALGNVIDEPIPVRLLDTVFSAPLSADAVPTRAMRPTRATWSERVTFAGKLRSLVMPLTTAHAVGAVGALLLVGIVSGLPRNLGPQETLSLVTMSGGRLLAHGPLLRGLETSPSGTQLAFGSGSESGSMRPLLTFKRHDGQHCRVYELDQASGLVANGVSCRNVAGQWTVELHDGAGTTKPSSGKIVPAAGSAPTIVDAAVDRMISGDAYGSDQETKLMKNQWRP